MVIDKILPDGGDIAVCGQRHVLNPIVHFVQELTYLLKMLIHRWMPLQFPGSLSSTACIRIIRAAIQALPRICYTHALCICG